MTEPLVPLPNLFWQLDVLHIPRDPWRLSSDSTFQDAKETFRHYQAQVRRGEEDGVVDRTDVVNLLLAGWTLKRNWRLRADADLAKQVNELDATARKYGLTRVWRAAYHSTMLRRLEEQSRAGRGERVSHCGRSGREIWNPISLRRRGPVCYHHVEVTIDELEERLRAGGLVRHRGVS